MAATTRMVGAIWKLGQCEDNRRRSSTRRDNYCV